jgi:hypothetical protein
LAEPERCSQDVQLRRTSEQADIRSLDRSADDRLEPSHRGTGTMPRSSFGDRSSGARTTG